MDTTETFLAEVEDFLTRHRMGHSTFSRLATRDKSFVARLRKGSGTNTRTVDHVREWMALYDRTTAARKARPKQAAVAA
jgi:hypothetical protein